MVEKVVRMFQLNDDFLDGLGLEAMPSEDRKDFLAHIYRELQARIGAELSRDLSDEQLAEFQQLAEAEDKTAAEVWLHEHCPDYKKVVNQEVEKLKQEIVASRDKLLG